MFDISTIALKDTTELHLRHPVTGDKLYSDAEGTKAVTITLYGSASKQYRSAVSAMQNRSLRRQAKKEKTSAEVLKEEGTELLVACSATSSELTNDGSPVKDPSDFRTLYSDPKYSWIKDQVDEALGDASNFLEQ